MYTFFYKKTFYKKINLKHPETLRKLEENLQPQMCELQFLKTLVKNADSYLIFFSVFIINGSTILFIKHAKVETLSYVGLHRAKMYVRKCRFC